jgi:hypothetical protein
LLFNNEFAKVIDIFPNCDTGSPCPHIISNSNKAVLIYYIAGDKEQIALIEFIQCYGHKMNHINDEVLNGHRLWKKGLQFYSGHIIEHSTWISDEMKVHSVHPRHIAKNWEDRKHYLLTFKDEIYEFIATDYQFTIYTKSIDFVLLEGLKRINQ